MIGHIKIVAILHIFLNLIGVLVGVACIVIALTGGSVLGLAAASEGANPAEAGGVAALIVTFGSLFGCAALIPSLPGFLGGIALLKHRDWARWVLVVVSALHLTAFPFGTALGVYSLWVLLHHETAGVCAGVIDSRPLP